MRRGIVFFLVLGLLLPVGGIAAAAAAPFEPVEVIGPWDVGSAEGEAFVAELATIQGIEVIYEQATGQQLIDRIEGEDPPDLVVISNPGLFVDLADHLVDLAAVVPEPRLRRDYGDYLIDQGSVDGIVVGAPIKMDLKSLVWYRPDEFAASGYSIPETFNELVALSDRMVADGLVPWCNYIESGFATGWVGTDWVEDLLLGAAGPAVYDQWVAHDVLFQDPRVETAFERYQQMIDTPGYVFDRPNMLNTFFWFNAIPLGARECLMHRQATFFASTIRDFGFDLADFDTFKFPSVDPAFSDEMVGGGNYVAALSRGPAVDRVTRYMLSNQWGRQVLASTAADTGWLVPNQRFQDRWYTNEFMRSWLVFGHESLASGQFRFDASDLMPPEVGAGTFWSGIVDLVAGTKTIPQILSEIDASWPAGP
jgi:alpha-glucoside transport system substrate-binding protein